MAIIVSIIIIVAYCVYDRQRTNDKQRAKALNERINATNGRVDALKARCDLIIRALLVSDVEERTKLIMQAADTGKDAGKDAETDDASTSGQSNASNE